MFKNIGKQIQSLCQTIFVLEAIISVCAGLSLGGFLQFLFREEMMMGVGVIVSLILIFLSWVGQLKLYAFGKIAECNEDQVRLLRQLLSLQAQAAGGPVPGLRQCPKCGCILDEDAVFCPECGSAYSH